MVFGASEFGARPAPPECGHATPIVGDTAYAGDWHSYRLFLHAEAIRLAPLLAPTGALDVTAPCADLDEAIEDRVAAFGAKQPATIERSADLHALHRAETIDQRSGAFATDRHLSSVGR